MTSEQKLTADELKKVASMIDGIILNQQYLDPDGDGANFSMLMFELHNKRFNLPGVTMDDFKPYLQKSFSEEVIDELNQQIGCISGLVYELKTNPREYLPEF